MSGPDEHEPEQAPDAVVADTAQLAANAAERAAGAAQDAIVHAEIAAAGVAQQAAEKTARTQEDMEQWQTSIQQQFGELRESSRAQNEALTNSLSQAMDQISSILTRLETKPESQESPKPESSATAEAGPKASEGIQTVPPEPQSQAKRKSHRWI